MGALVVFDAKARNEYGVRAVSRAADQINRVVGHSAEAWANGLHHIAAPNDLDFSGSDGIRYIDSKVYVIETRFFPLLI